MNSTLLPVARPSQTPNTSHRRMEGEGIFRMLLLAFAVALPLGTLAYMRIQQTRLNYEMSELKELIKQEEETQRKLILERSRFERDEAVQAFAKETGMLPRKQSHLINRAFTTEDQKLAHFQPVSSDTF